MLRRHGLSRLRDLDCPSGIPVRYVREHLGELLHLDVKKLGRIPPGGGHRILVREERRKGRSRGAGYDHIHVAMDDASRVAYVEALADERGETAARFLLGGTEEEVRGAGERIEERFDGLRVVGTHNGHYDLSGDENETVIRAIKEAQPEVLLVAMGFPRQEEWIAANLSQLQVNVAVAEGGSFSFISGVTPRAPRRLRRLGLEWLYRLARQPWRLQRQLAIPQFVWLVVRERLRATRAGS